MRRGIVLMAIVIIAAGCIRRSTPDTSSSSNSDQKNAAAVTSSDVRAQTACGLLTPNELAGFLNVPEVKKDELNSGMNGMTKVDHCYWYVKEGSPEGIGIRLRRAQEGEGASSLAFSAARGDAVEHDAERDRKVQPLSGVADEAIYSPYPVGPGGSIALRVGGSAVTITGSPSREALVSVAKLVAHRL